MSHLSVILRQSKRTLCRTYKCVQSVSSHYTPFCYDNSRMQMAGWSLGSAEPHIIYMHSDVCPIALEWLT